MKAVFDRLFSPMRKHDELPEMTWPLAVLLMAGTAVFAAAAARLATPVSPAPFEPVNLVGCAASFPFLPMAVCLYALIILLWRRTASLLATPAAFAVMLVFGADLFTAAAYSLMLLLSAYVFAVSLIGKESRFHRRLTLTLAVALSLSLIFLSWIALRFGSFERFTERYMTDVPAYISEAYAAFAAQAANPSPEIVVLPDESVRAAAREFFVMLPAYLGVLSTAMAWLTDFLCRSAFRLLGCEECFLDNSRRITMPRRFAVIYAAALFLTLFTSSAEFPLMYALFRSVLTVMILPCAVIGVEGAAEGLEERLYYMTREKLLTAILLFLAFTILGAGLFVVIASIFGAYYVIRPEKSEEGEE